MRRTEVVSSLTGQVHARVTGGHVVDHEDQGVLTGTVNTFLELARKNAKNYLSLVPQLYHLLTNTTNNWLSIKLLKVFRDFAAEFGIDVYLDRVSTDANPSDGMSRDKHKEAEARGWKVVETKFPDSMNISRAKA